MFFIYLVSFYDFKWINTVLNILCVWVLTVFKVMYYYDTYKCLVFYIVLECVLNHTVGCDIIAIKKV